MFRFLLISILMSGCAVEPKPEVQATGAKKTATKEKNQGTAVTGCKEAENCKPIKLTVIAQPLKNGILEGYVGQPLNWQFSLDANGAQVTRGIGISLIGPPQSWPNGIPPQVGMGSVTILARDIERCKLTEKNPADCTNINVNLPNYDARGTFNFQIVQSVGSNGMYPAPSCQPSSGPSTGMIIGSIASLINPLAFIPMAIVNGIISSKPSC